jgi:hypothetical protein
LGAGPDVLKMRIGAMISAHTSSSVEVLANVHLGCSERALLCALSRCKGCAYVLAPMFYVL